MSFNRNYANHYANPPLPAPRLSSLYGAVTGDFGDALYFPMNAVRWKTHARNIAALVTGSGKRSFNAELYHFGDDIRSMGAELYLLDKGTYTVVLTNTGTGTSQASSLTVSGPRSTIAFELEPRTTYRLDITHKD